MTTAPVSARRRWLGSSTLLVAVLGTGGGLAAWKEDSLEEAAAAAAAQPEPMEAVTVAVAGSREHRRTTTAIGTVIALQSITLHNELPGTVRDVRLQPGQVVEAGALLVALDVGVEEAELKAQEAEAALAQTMLERMERATSKSAASAADLDRARAQRDIAQAQVARTKAVIARKTVRAPFRARVGMADVHLGQYLNEGTLLTTLQGIDDAVHVDFNVTQAVAAGLEPGDRVEIARGSERREAEIVAVDARVDPATRNAVGRARLEDDGRLAPGASVRVRVPVTEAATVVTVPVRALRKGPSGDHVFVVAPDDQGNDRAHVRPVTSGATLGDEVVIHEGLKAGEEVAASGSFKLFESVRVARLPAGAPAPSPSGPGSGN
jgi:membrane fusion protein (multidrug efflux system)